MGTFKNLKTKKKNLENRKGENQTYISLEYHQRLNINFVFKLFGRLVYRFGHPKTHQVLFFRLCFNKKYVEVAINDFTVHLIISKCLRIQKCRQKRKTTRSIDERKKETVNKIVFIHLKIMQVFAFSLM